MHQLSSANLRNVQTRMGDEASADLGMAMDSGHGVGVIVSSNEAMLAQLFERKNTYTHTCRIDCQHICMYVQRAVYVCIHMSVCCCSACAHILHFCKI